MTANHAQYELSVRSVVELIVKPHPDSEVEFWHVGNLTACGTSPSQGEV